MIGVIFGILSLNIRGAFHGKQERAQVSAASIITFCFQFELRFVLDISMKDHKGCGGSGNGSIWIYMV